MNWHTIEGATWYSVYFNVRRLLICMARGHDWGTDADTPNLRHCRRCYRIDCNH